MLKTAAMLHDIKTVTYSDENDNMRIIPTRAVKMAVADLMKAPAEETEPAPVPKETKAGLMQRKSKVGV
jgi:hypothetical protein